MGRFLGGLVTFTSVKSCWQSTVKEDKNKANLVAEHCLCRAFLPAAGRGTGALFLPPQLCFCWVFCVKGRLQMPSWVRTWEKEVKLRFQGFSKQWFQGKPCTTGLRCPEGCCLPNLIHKPRGKRSCERCSPLSRKTQILTCQHLYQSADSSCLHFARRDDSEQLKGQQQASFNKANSRHYHSSLPKIETFHSTASKRLTFQNVFYIFC